MKTTAFNIPWNHKFTVSWFSMNLELDSQGFFSKYRTLHMPKVPEKPNITAILLSFKLKVFGKLPVWFIRSKFLWGVFFLKKGELLKSICFCYNQWLLKTSIKTVEVRLYFLFNSLLFRKIIWLIGKTTFPFWGFQFLYDTSFRQKRTWHFRYINVLHKRFFINFSIFFISSGISNKTILFDCFRK